MSHIGNIHHLNDRVVFVFEIPAEDVRKNERPKVTDVCVVIDSESTTIHTDGFAVKWAEFFLAP